MIAVSIHFPFIHVRSKGANPAGFTHQRLSGVSSFVFAAAIVAIITAVSAVLPEALDLSNRAMLYLLGVVIVSVCYGRAPSIFASIASVAAFDFFFVHPYFTFAVADTQYLITLGVMLFVALTICSLAATIREQIAAAEKREARTAAILDMAEKLSNAGSEEDLIASALRCMGEVISGSVTHRKIDARGSGRRDGVDRHDEFALNVAGRHHGFIIVRMEGRAPLLESQRTILQLMTHQLSLALDRRHLIAEQQRISLQVETERIRNALLSSVSHDLRTPLATIAGSASVLMEDAPQIDSHVSHSLAESIFEESQRLNRIIENLVCSTRLESGAIKIRREWVSIEEIVGTALNRMRKKFRGRALSIKVSADLPLINADGLLLELALVNVLENAVKYTPEGTSIAISAKEKDGVIVIYIADSGPGIPRDARSQIFERFIRGDQRGAEGIGLGLYICGGIMRAHGGKILVEDSELGGAQFVFEIPAREIPEFHLMEGLAHE